MESRKEPKCKLDQISKIIGHTSRSTSGIRTKFVSLPTKITRTTSGQNKKQKSSPNDSEKQHQEQQQQPINQLQQSNVDMNDGESEHRKFGRLRKTEIQQTIETHKDSAKSRLLSSSPQNIETGIELDRPTSASPQTVITRLSGLRMRNSTPSPQHRKKVKCQVVHGSRKVSISPDIVEIHNESHQMAVNQEPSKPNKLQDIKYNGGYKVVSFSPDTIQDSYSIEPDPNSRRNLSSPQIVCKNKRDLKPKRCSKSSQKTMRCEEYIDDGQNSESSIYFAEDSNEMTPETTLMDCTGEFVTTISDSEQLDQESDKDDNRPSSDKSYLTSRKHIGASRFDPLDTNFTNECESMSNLASIRNQSNPAIMQQSNQRHQNVYSDSVYSYKMTYKYPKAGPIRQHLYYQNCASDRNVADPIGRWMNRSHPYYHKNPMDSCIYGKHKRNDRYHPDTGYFDNYPRSSVEYGMRGTTERTSVNICCCHKIKNVEEDERHTSEHLPHDLTYRLGIHHSEPRQSHEEFCTIPSSKYFRSPAHETHLRHHSNFQSTNEEYMRPIHHSQQLQMRTISKYKKARKKPIGSSAVEIIDFSDLHQHRDDCYIIDLKDDINSTSNKEQITTEIIDIDNEISSEESDNFEIKDTIPQKANITITRPIPFSNKIETPAKSLSHSEKIMKNRMVEKLQKAKLCRDPIVHQKKTFENMMDNSRFYYQDIVDKLDPIEEYDILRSSQSRNAQGTVSRTKQKKEAYQKSKKHTNVIDSQNQRTCAIEQDTKDHMKYRNTVMDDFDVTFPEKLIEVEDTIEEENRILEVPSSKYMHRHRPIVQSKQKLWERQQRTKPFEASSNTKILKVKPEAKSVRMETKKHNRTSEDVADRYTGFQIKNKRSKSLETSLKVLISEKTPKTNAESILISPKTKESKSVKTVEVKENKLAALYTDILTLPKSKKSKTVNTPEERLDLSAKSKKSKTVNTQIEVTHVEIKENENMNVQSGKNKSKTLKTPKEKSQNLKLPNSVKSFKSKKNKALKITECDSDNHNTCSQTDEISMITGSDPENTLYETNLKYADNPLMCFKSPLQYATSSFESHDNTVISTDNNVLQDPTETDVSFENVVISPVLKDMELDSILPCEDGRPKSRTIPALTDVLSGKTDLLLPRNQLNPLLIPLVLIRHIKFRPKSFYVTLSNRTVYRQTKNEKEHLEFIKKYSEPFYSPSPTTSKNTLNTKSDQQSVISICVSSSDDDDIRYSLVEDDLDGKVDMVDVDEFVDENADSDASDSDGVDAIDGDDVDAIDGDDDNSDDDHASSHNHGFATGTDGDVEDSELDRGGNSFQNSFNSEENSTDAVEQSPPAKLFKISIKCGVKLNSSLAESNKLEKASIDDKQIEESRCVLKSKFSTSPFKAKIKSKASTEIISHCTNFTDDYTYNENTHSEEGLVPKNKQENTHSEESNVAKFDSKISGISNLNQSTDQSIEIITDLDMSSSDSSVEISNAKMISPFKHTTENKRSKTEDTSDITRANISSSMDGDNESSFSQKSTLVKKTRNSRTARSKTTATKLLRKAINSPSESDSSLKQAQVIDIQPSPTSLPGHFSSSAYESEPMEALKNKIVEQAEHVQYNEDTKLKESNIEPSVMSYEHKKKKIGRSKTKISLDTEMMVIGANLISSNCSQSEEESKSTCELQDSFFEGQIVKTDTSLEESTADISSTITDRRSNKLPDFPKIDKSEKLVKQLKLPNTSTPKFVHHLKDCLQPELSGISEEEANNHDTIEKIGIDEISIPVHRKYKETIEITTLEKKSLELPVENAVSENLEYYKSKTLTSKSKTSTPKSKTLTPKSKSLSLTPQKKKVPVACALSVLKASESNDSNQLTSRNETSLGLPIKDAMSESSFVSEVPINTDEISGIMHIETECDADGNGNRDESNFGTAENEGDDVCVITATVTKTAADSTSDLGSKKLKDGQIDVQHFLQGYMKHLIQNPKLLDDSGFESVRTPKKIDLDSYNIKLKHKSPSDFNISWPCETISLDAGVKNTHKQICKVSKESVDIMGEISSLLEDILSDEEPDDLDQFKSVEEIDLLISQKNRISNITSLNRMGENKTTSIKSPKETIVTKGLLYPKQINKSHSENATIDNRGSQDSSDILVSGKTMLLKQNLEKQMLAKLILKEQQPENKKLVNLNVEQKEENSMPVSGAKILNDSQKTINFDFHPGCLNNYSAIQDPVQYSNDGCGLSTPIPSDYFDSEISSESFVSVQSQNPENYVATKIGYVTVYNSSRLQEVFKQGQAVVELVRLKKKMEIDGVLWKKKGMVWRSCKTSHAIGAGESKSPLEISQFIQEIRKDTTTTVEPIEEQTLTELTDFEKAISNPKKDMKKKIKRPRMICRSTLEENQDLKVISAGDAKKVIRFQTHSPDVKHPISKLAQNILKKKAMEAQKAEATKEEDLFLEPPGSFEAIISKKPEAKSQKETKTYIKKPQKTMIAAPHSFLKFDSSFKIPSKKMSEGQEVSHFCSPLEKGYQPDLTFEFTKSRKISLLQSGRSVMEKSGFVFGDTRVSPLAKKKMASTFEKKKTFQFAVKSLNGSNPEDELQKNNLLRNLESTFSSNNKSISEWGKEKHTTRLLFGTKSFSVHSDETKSLPSTSPKGNIFPQSPLPTVSDASMSDVSTISSTCGVKRKLYDPGNSNFVSSLKRFRFMESKEEATKQSETSKTLYKDIFQKEAKELLAVQDSKIGTSNIQGESHETKSIEQTSSRVKAVESDLRTTVELSPSPPPPPADFDLKVSSSRIEEPTLLQGYGSQILLNSDLAMSNAKSPTYEVGEVKENIDEHSPQDEKNEDPEGDVRQVTSLRSSSKEASNGGSNSEQDMNEEPGEVIEIVEISEDDSSEVVESSSSESESEHESTELKDDVLSLLPSDDEFMDEFVEVKSAPKSKSKLKSPTKKPTDPEVKEVPSDKTIKQMRDSDMELVSSDGSSEKSDQFKMDLANVKNQSKLFDRQNALVLIPNSFCYDFVITQQCRNKPCRYSHVIPNDSEVSEHVSNQIRCALTENRIKNAVDFYMLAKEKGFNLPQEFVKPVLNACFQLGYSYSQLAHHLLGLVFQKQVLDARLCNDFIKICSVNRLECCDKLWEIFDVIQNLNLHPSPEALITLLMTFYELKKFVQLFSIMSYCNELEGFIIPMFIREGALIEAQMNPPKFRVLAESWICHATEDSLIDLSTMLIQQLFEMFMRSNSEVIAQRLASVLQAKPEPSNQAPQIEEPDVDRDEAELMALSDFNDERHQSQEKISFMHRIQGCKLSYNWKYLAEIYLELCGTEWPRNSDYIDLYVNTLTSVMSDKLIEAFRDFLDKLRDTYQKERSLNVLLEFDHRCLSQICCGILKFCCSKDLFVAGYYILSLMFEYDIKICSEKPGNLHQPLQHVMHIALRAEEPRSAIKVLQDIHWLRYNADPVTNLDTYIDQLDALIKQLLSSGWCQQAYQVLCFFIHILEKAGKTIQEIDVLDLHFNEICYRSLQMGIVEAAVNVFCLYRSKFLTKQLFSANLLRSLFAVCYEINDFENAQEIFQYGVLRKIYMSQNFSESQIIVGAQMTLGELNFVLKDYLKNLYRCFCSEIMDGKQLTVDDLNIVIIVVRDPNSGVIQYSNTPKSEYASHQLLKLSLEKLSPPLKSVFNPSKGCHLLDPESLQEHLNYIDKKEMQQGLRFGPSLSSRKGNPSSLPFNGPNVAVFPQRSPMLRGSHPRYNRHRYNHNNQNQGYGRWKISRGKNSSKI